MKIFTIRVKCIAKTKDPFVGGTYGPYIAETAEDALDKFHATVPIPRPEDFEITAVEDKPT